MKIHRLTVITCTLALLNLTLAGCTCTQCMDDSNTSMAATHGTDADRAAIDAILADWATGWQTRDAALATRGYSDDADFTNAFGFHRKGQPAIEQYIAEVFTLEFVMAGTSGDGTITVRFIRDDVALARTRRSRTGQLMPDGSPLPTRDITHLRVFQKNSAGQWEIASHLISDARETQGPGT